MWIKVLIVHVSLISMWAWGLNGLALGTAMVLVVAALSWLAGRKSAKRSVPSVIKLPRTQTIVFRG